MTLIERLEAATGPDRELDAEIYCEARGLVFEDECPVRSSGKRVIDFRPVSHYTASIDAALTLVPEGLSWTCGKNLHHGYFAVSLNTLNERGAPESVAWADADYPAIALCIAALKARQEKR